MGEGLDVYGFFLSFGERYYLYCIITKKSATSRSLALAPCLSRGGLFMLKKRQKGMGEKLRGKEPPFYFITTNEGKRGGKHSIL